MGTDKATLPWPPLVAGAPPLDQVPLWQWQLDILRALEPSELLISGPADGAYAGSGVRVLPDQEPGMGPLGGIITVLRQAAFERVVVLAVDMPHMQSLFLRGLLQEAVALGQGIFPRHNGRFEPLAAVYGKDLLDLAVSQLETGDGSLQRFLERCVVSGRAQPRELLGNEPALFTNLNSPTDIFTRRRGERGEFLM
jgi:molybdopterin-guanine dinucleotide biosynthesis protein A